MADPSPTLDPRYQRLERLFREAVELRAEERNALLEAAYPGDPALRSEAAALLAAHDAASREQGGAGGGFLEQLDAGLAAALVEEEVGGAKEGEMIGRYRVLRILGRGGMGVVYLAHDPRLDRPVALKLLPPHLAIDEAARRRFFEEARAASSTEHPNIATVLELDETADGRVFLAMAYCEGETLDHRLLRGPLLIDEAVGLAAQIARGLAAAHARGVVHRDIKPANVIVTPDGTAKILDFGVAKMAGHALTQPGVHLGTVAYMSPEQTRSGDVDARADLWSLGAVLYEMLTGRRPFAAESEQALIYSIRNDKPPPLEEARPDASAALRALVERCLAKDPGARYPDTRSLLEELGRITGEPYQPRRSRRRAMWIAASLLLGAALFFALPRGSGRTGELPPGTTVAVLPFAPAVHDTALWRLGRELALTVSRGLDGVAGLRAVDPLTLLAQAEEERRYAPEEAAGLARRLGAGRLVQGTLVRTAGGVRLDLALLDAARARRLAGGWTAAAVGDIVALTDSATLVLLREASGQLSAPAGQAAAMTTSVLALRAFLEGERAVAENRFHHAADAFARAIAADSSFWLAYWRYAHARRWWGEAVDSVIVVGIRDHLNAVPEPDRLLAAAWLDPSEKERLARRRAIVGAYSDHWPAWFELAEQLVHIGPYLGTTHIEARAALERLVGLNPNLLPGWDHLFWVLLFQRDSGAAHRVLEQLGSLGNDTQSQAEGRLGNDLYYRYLVQVMERGGEPGPLADAGAALLASLRGPEPENHSFGLSLYGFHRAQIDLADRILALPAPQETHAAHWYAKSGAWAARGAWDSALVAAGLYARLKPTVAAALEGYRLAVVGRWLGAVDPAVGRAWAQRLRRIPSELPPSSRAERLWLDGLLAAAGRDRAALAAARRSLAGTGAEATTFLDRSLAGFEMELDGDRAAAASALFALEFEIADQSAHFRFGSDHPYLTAVDRLAAARWLLAAGDTLRAAHLLSFHEAIFPPRLRLLTRANQILAAPGYLERARIEEAAGRFEVARGYYARFLERWDRPVEPLRPLVEEGRMRLMVLDPGRRRATSR
jgi:TolB-like protein